MADDIVTRLRIVDHRYTEPWSQRLMDEAADEIERLRADRDRWRRIADGFAEAGTHPTAHSIALEEYEKAQSYE